MIEERLAPAWRPSVKARWNGMRGVYEHRKEVSNIFPSLSKAILSADFHKNTMPEGLQLKSKAIIRYRRLATDG